MKSLHIIGSKQMGGAERWFVRFLAAMQRRGNPVEALVRAGSDLARHRRLDFPHRELPMRSTWDPLSRLELSRAIAASDAPIVQTYMGRATRLTRLQPGRGKVHVSRLGGFYPLHPFRHAHAWIGNTKGLCDWMVRNGLPADRVYHLTNFADPAEAVPPSELDALRQRIGHRAEDWLIVTAGRLIEVKGHRFLVDAMRRLPAEIAGRRPRLIVLGDGRLRETLQTQARQAAVADRILWAGWQHDPGPWFHLADMVVYPSRDAEALGNVIFEAWAYGKPLVTTAFLGAREIARHGEDAWMAPCDDGAALAAGMEHLIRHPDLRRDLARQGSARVEREFAETTIIGQYRQVYASLLDKF
jgi:hypothetical protein